MAVTFRVKDLNDNIVYATDPSFLFHTETKRVFMYVPGRGQSVECPPALITEQRLQAAFNRARGYDEMIDLTHPDHLAALYIDSSEIFWRQENHLPSETAQAVAEILSVKPPV